MASSKGKAAAGKSKIKSAAKTKQNTSTKTAKPKARSRQDDGQEPVARKMDDAVRGAAVRPHQDGALQAGVRSRLCRQPERDRGDRRQQGAADLRQYHRCAGAFRRDARSRRIGFLQPLRHRQHARDPGDRARDRAALCQAQHGHLPEPRAVPARRCADAAEGQAGLEPGAGPRAGALPPRVREVGRGARREGAQAARGHRAGGGDARHQVRPERAGRRAGLPAGAGAGRGPGRTARVGAGGGGANRHRAQASGQARHYAVAVERGAVPEILRAPRPAREGVQGLDQARRQGRQDRQPADRGRHPEAAGRAGTSVGLQDAGGFDARILDGEDAGQREEAADRRVGAGAGARPGGAGRPAGCRAVGGRQLQARGLGLALLRREGAQDPLRRRRGGDQAIPAARQRHCRGVRCGGASCSA